MADTLVAALTASASGLSAQSQRLRVVSENLANAYSTGATAGSDPYQRKTITFADELDRATGATLVEVADVNVDRTPFGVEFEPGHPAADEQGYVKMPNVDVLVELADLRETNRSYEANLQAISRTRGLITITLDLLKGNQA
jgi:flagellar basal-body rod protein FlgC